MVTSLVPSLLFKNEILVTTVKNYAKPEFKMVCFYPIFVLFLLSQIFCQGLELKQFRLEVKYLNRSCFLRLRETYRFAIVFFLLFLVFLPAVCWTSELQINIPEFKNLSIWRTSTGSWALSKVCKNWYLHLQKTNDHQIRQAGTSRGVDSNETQIKEVLVTQSL